MHIERMHQPIVILLLKVELAGDEVAVLFRRSLIAKSDECVRDRFACGLGNHHVCVRAWPKFRTGIMRV